MFNKKYGIISIGVLAIAMGQITNRIRNVIYPSVIPAIISCVRFGADQCYYVYREKKA